MKKGQLKVNLSNIKNQYLDIKVKSNNLKIKEVPLMIKTISIELT